MKKCYSCDVEITQSNKSKEHIIPNSCGGRWVSEGLLCQECNSTLGDSLDAVLAKQINDLANLLMIERDRGTPNPTKGELESSGEIYFIQSSGKPVMSKPQIQEESHNSLLKISIKAKDQKQLRQVLNGLKRKDPELDVEELVNSAKVEKRLFSEPLTIELSIGGPEVFRAITKIAINYFIEKTGESQYIKHLIPFLKGNVNRDSTWIYYPDREVYQPTSNEVSHVIHLKGDVNQKILYAYVELFNVFCFIVNLNENYDGVYLDECYVFEVLGRKQISRRSSVNYSRDEIFYSFDNKKLQIDFSKVKNKLQRVLSIAKERQGEKHRQFLIEQAMKKSFYKYPEGTEITPEIINEFINELVNEDLIYLLGLTQVFTDQ